MFSRRSVLAASAAASLLTQTQDSSAAGDALAACRSNLARLFPNSLDEAQALGRRCATDGQGAATLLDRLCRDGLDRQRLATAPVEELRAAIDAQIRADYAQGRTRRVDGWVLSATETSLFAFLAG